MLHYLADAPPPFAVPVPVADGLLWMRLAMPYGLDYVDVTLLRDRDRDGWLVVDTGVDDPPTRAAWSAVLAGLDGPVTRIVLTHNHADHAGAAGWLQQVTGATVLISAPEWRALQASVTPDPAARARYEAHQRRMGCSAAEVRGLVGRFHPTDTRIGPLPVDPVFLGDGDVLEAGGRRWTVLCRPGGHAPAPVMLHDPAGAILIAGDQILPTISPYVGVRANDPDADPLEDYLAHLAMTEAAVAPDTLVLSGHGLPFRGVAARLHALRVRHRRRIARVEEACATGPRTVRALVEILFRDRGEAALPMTVATTLAYVNRLRHEGRLEAREVDGVLRLAAPAAARAAAAPLLG